MKVRTGLQFALAPSWRYLHAMASDRFYVFLIILVSTTNCYCIVCLAELKSVVVITRF
jgi:hypothetical protein